MWCCLCFLDLTHFLKQFERTQRKESWLTDRAACYKKSRIISLPFHWLAGKESSLHFNGTCELVPDWLPKWLQEIPQSQTHWCRYVGVIWFVFPCSLTSTNQIYTRKPRWLSEVSDRGDFLGITGCDPRVCKSNRLHVDVLRFSFH